MKETGPKWPHRLLVVWLVMVICAGVVTATVAYGELPLTGGLIGGFIAGLLTGTIGRDYRYVLEVRRRWPVIREITDWTCVQELLDQ